MFAMYIVPAAVGQWCCFFFFFFWNRKLPLKYFTFTKQLLDNVCDVSVIAGDAKKHFTLYHKITNHAWIAVNTHSLNVSNVNGFFMFKVG